MEMLPTNVINLMLICCSHPVADIIKPRITFRSDGKVKPRLCKQANANKYYHSKQYDSLTHKEFKKFVVISRNKTIRE